MRSGSSACAQTRRDGAKANAAPPASSVRRVTQRERLLRGMMKSLEYRPPTARKMQAGGERITPAGRHKRARRHSLFIK
jgi:hypothetical protein